MVIGVGSGGLIATVRGEPRPFDGGEEGLDETLRYEGLDRTATLLDVACTRSDPLECLAVGRDGLVVRGDGVRWSVERLPAAGARADVTSVRYAGRTALAATSAGLYVTPEAGTWRREPQVTGPVRVVDALEDGGAVVDGRWARDGAGQPWHATSAPLEREVIAVAAVRDGARVRPLAVTAEEAPPLPEPLAAEAPDEPSDDPLDDFVFRLDPQPVDTVVLRETADGWVDLDRAIFQPSGGRDLPATTANTRVALADAQGTGWLLGGFDPELSSGLPFFLTGGTVRRLQGGAPAAEPAEPSPAGPPAPEPAVEPGRVRLAIGGHPACLDRCGAAGGQGVAADVHLAAAARQVDGLAAAHAAPAAIVVAGGRASVGGEPLDGPGARRYRELLARFSVPTFVAPGGGDLVRGGAAAFAQAFAGWAAPVGTGALPPGIAADPSLQPPGPPGRTRTSYAFDVQAPAGAVRVVVVDNAAGRLAGGAGGAQARWLDGVLARSAADGVPVVAVGSAPLDDTAGARPAADAAEEIGLLAGRVSAYVATAGEDDPSSPRFGGALTRSEAGPDGVAPLTLLQSSTLGLSPSGASVRLEPTDDESFEVFRRTSAAALMLLDVEVSRSAPGANVVPVHPLGEPLVDGLRLDSQAVAGVGQATYVSAVAYDVAQLRFLRPVEGGAAAPSRGGDVVFLPADRCQLVVRRCEPVVTNATFASSNPGVGLFVAVATDGERPGPPRVVVDARGNVVPDPRSPVFCPIGTGTTTISVRAAGLTHARTITVADQGRAGVGTGRPGETRPVPEGTCAFAFTTDLDEEPEEAEEQPPPPVPGPVPPPVPVPAPAPDAPAPKAATKSSPSPSPQPSARVPASQPPLPALALPAPVPPVADAAPPQVSVTKPPAPPLPAPPPGVSVQQAPVTATQVHAQVQVQVQGAVQSAEQRRVREALEGEHAAAAYAPPGERARWELIGLGALLLAAGGGSVAGRARAARAPAYARASVRRR